MARAIDRKVEEVRLYDLDQRDDEEQRFLSITLWDDQTITIENGAVGEDDNRRITSWTADEFNDVILPTIKRLLRRATEL